MAVSSEVGAPTLGLLHEIILLRHLDNGLSFCRFQLQTHQVMVPLLITVGFNGETMTIRHGSGQRPRPFVRSTIQRISVWPAWPVSRAEDRISIGSARDNEL
jgi:hypothetical protein